MKYEKRLRQLLIISLRGVNEEVRIDDRTFYLINDKYAFINNVSFLLKIT